MNTQLDLPFLPMAPAGASEERAPKLGLASGSPPWWTAEDSEALERYAEWKSADWYPPIGDMDALEWDRLPATRAAQKRLNEYLALHIEKWRCRRCAYWQSTDGRKGDCTYSQPPPDEYGPIGETIAESCCEEWTPANASHEP